MGHDDPDYYGEKFTTRADTATWALVLLALIAAVMAVCAVPV